MKTTLITVSGMSPAIITETIWALATESPAVVPDDVVVITTAKGEDDIRDSLLTARENWGNLTVWEHLRQDVLAVTGQPGQKNRLQLSIRVIEIPDAKSGVKQKAHDLRTREDNDAAADFMIQCIAPFVDDVDNHVVASIAGGRKSMGALLYGTMNLIGKGTDRITHVLVNEPYELSREFFYPQQPVQELKIGPGSEPTIVRAADARVEMADLMFVPLRNRFAELNEPRRSFSGLVDKYALTPRPLHNRLPKVALDIDKSRWEVEGKSIKLAGRNLVITSFLYTRALQGKPLYRHQADALDDLNEFLTEWKKLLPFHPGTSRLPDEYEDETNIAKVLYDLRKFLTSAKLEHTIPFLAPVNERLGFEIEIIDRKTSTSPDIPPKA
jgi:CRISPR-associated protein (TIGR02584 family)